VERRSLSERSALCAVEELVLSGTKEPSLSGALSAQSKSLTGNSGCPSTAASQSALSLRSGRGVACALRSRRACPEWNEGASLSGALFAQSKSLTGNSGCPSIAASQSALSLRSGRGVACALRSRRACPEWNEGALPERRALCAVEGFFCASAPEAALDTRITNP
jgi:hypothetical protein